MMERKYRENQERMDVLEKEIDKLSAELEGKPKARRTKKETGEASSTSKDGFYGDAFWADLPVKPGNDSLCIVLAVTFFMP